MTSAATLLDEGFKAFRRGDFSTAAAHFELAKTSDPTDYRALTNLGASLRRLDRFDEAEAALNQAVALAPHHPFPRLNLANFKLYCGALTEAEALYRDTLALAPEDARAGDGLGRTLLALGRYSEGWPLHELRTSANAAPTGLPAAEWLGEPIAGRRLLVWPEQGLGDAIMCARYLPLLRASGAEVSFVCPAAISPLFHGLGVSVIPRHEVTRVPPVDLAVRIFSLPHRFGTTLEAMPPPVPLTTRAAKSAGRIGVVWRGNPAQENDRHRSLPASLGEELLAIPGSMSLHPDDTGVGDFAETAAIVAGLDLVISVDTSIAHLAASMGKPTWILLPHHGTDFRWMRDRTDSPWYPAARLWRQSAPSQWGEVVAQVVSALRVCSSRGSGPAAPMSEPVERLLRWYR